jgi:cysteine-rich repeat protein
VCKLATCGDGFKQPGEDCDLGAGNSNAGTCTLACKAPKCGDEFVQASNLEECDDGNLADTDGCVGACKLAKCGDSFVQAGVEQCDDANQSNTDACTTQCKAAACGDGFVQAGIGEQCDDGNLVPTDACTAACKSAVCGDGIVRAGVEDCDDGNGINSDACVGMCKAAKCGDGFVQAGVEECDDGNANNADACSNQCKNVLTAKKNCKEVLAGQPGAPSGLYSIDPDGNGGEPAFQTFCDMTTDGGGWTLILNRNVNSDNLGQPDINVPHGAFDNARATNWNFDVDLFWADATQWVFADKQNNNCNNCAITGYDSAIRADKPGAASYANLCPGTSQQVNVRKLVGPQAGTNGVAYQCGASLGWGACGGKNCHFGVHYQDTSFDGAWSQNQWNEMHFPSAYSNYKAYGDWQQEPSAWCRSCGGGLDLVFNNSSSCCNGNGSSVNAKARWTIWVR